MNRSIALTLVAVLWVAAPASHIQAAPSPLEELARAMHWLLTFVDDPYATNVKEILEATPNQAALALKDAIRFPADGDAEEQKLVERFSTIPPNRVPKSLRKFVESRFGVWRNGQKPSSLKLRIVDAVPMVPRGEARVRDGRLLLPVATIGRDLLRTVRDDKGLFKNFWWILSHPTFATTRPTANVTRFNLTGGCSSDPLKPTVTPQRCGGQAFYDSRREDVGAAVVEIERAFAERLDRTFSDALAK